jgi:hypothetical protein
LPSIRFETFAAPLSLSLPCITPPAKLSFYGAAREASPAGASYIALSRVIRGAMAVPHEDLVRDVGWALGRRRGVRIGDSAQHQEHNVFSSCSREHDATSLSYEDWNSPSSRSGGQLDRVAICSTRSRGLKGSGPGRWGATDCDCGFNDPTMNQAPPPWSAGPGRLAGPDSDFRKH